MGNAKAVTMVVNIIEIILSIVSVLGIYYITKAVWDPTKCQKELTSGKKTTMARIALVLIWIQLAFALLAAGMNMFGRANMLGPQGVITPGTALVSAFQ